MLGFGNDVFLIYRHLARNFRVKREDAKESQGSKRILNLQLMA